MFASGPRVMYEGASTISDAIPGRSSVPEVVREHFPTSADGACFGLTGAFTARAGNRDPAPPEAIYGVGTESAWP